MPIPSPNWIISCGLDLSIDIMPCIMAPGMREEGEEERSLNVEAENVENTVA
jgi:hypothetical protein